MRLDDGRGYVFSSQSISVYSACVEHICCTFYVLHIFQAMRKWRNLLNVCILNHVLDLKANF